MNTDELKLLEFRTRMLHARSVEIRGQLVSAYGRDHNATMLAEDLVCASADLSATLCELQPKREIEVPRDVPRQGRWDKKGATP